MDLYTLLISVLQNKEAMELLRLGIIYIHLIACCVAIGLILTSDFAMIKQLLKGEGAKQCREHLAHLKSVVGISLIALWISGIMQGMMWRAVNTDGTLTYSFVQSLEASMPFYLMRFIGGAFVVAGMLLMAYNVYKTVSSKTPAAQPAAAAA